jgi:hypothetical protein
VVLQFDVVGQGHLLQQLPQGELGREDLPVRCEVHTMQLGQLRQHLQASCDVPISPIILESSAATWRRKSINAQVIGHNTALYITTDVRAPQTQCGACCNAPKQPASTGGCMQRSLWWLLANWHASAG